MSVTDRPVLSRNAAGRRSRLKTAVHKASVLIPLAAVGWMLLCPITLSFPGIGLDLRYGMCTFIFVIASVAWLCYSPLRASCCDGSWAEPLFNLVPAEVMLTLVFAQWHPWWCLFILVLLLTAESVLQVYLTAGRNTLQKCALAVLTIALAVPCLMAGFVYRLRGPVFQAEADVMLRLLPDTPEQAAAAEADAPSGEDLALLRCLGPDRWDSFGITERITVMQGLAGLVSGDLGVPAPPVTAQSLPDSVLGQYDTETNEIWIDTGCLAGAPVDACIDTICHETFHAYQQYVVNGVDWDSDVTRSAYFDELRAWKENGENYAGALISGVEAYENQPLEAAARAYAQEQTQKLLSYIE